MSDLQRHIRELLNDSEFRKAWEESEGEFQAMKALVEARNEAGITQTELAEQSGIRQETISRIESGIANTTVRTLAKVAKALNKELRIEFV